MQMPTELTQVPITPDQRAGLESLAEERSRPVAALIREAIDAYLTPVVRGRREALADLLTLDAPVAGRETMKAEISTGSGT